MFKTGLNYLLLILTFLFVTGKFAVANPTLDVDSAAPPFSVEKWIGSPVEIQKGKIYVIDFWATWCGPCISAFPHLSKIQKEFGDKGVSVIAVAGSEEGDSIEEKQSKIIKALGELKKEDDLEVNFGVALDHSRKMFESWMTAAGDSGIPNTFVIDRDGSIVYIGHPMNLKDEYLQQILDGTWKSNGNSDHFKNQRRIENEKRNVRNQYITQIQDALSKKDWLGALKLVDSALERADDLLDLQAIKLDLLLVKLKRTEEGLALAEKWARAAWDNHYYLATYLSVLVSEELGLIQLRPNLNWEIGQRILEKMNLEDEEWAYAFLPAVARVHFLSGRVEEAIKLQQKVLASAPDHYRDHFLPAMEQYKKELAPKPKKQKLECVGGVCTIQPDENLKKVENVKPQPANDDNPTDGSACKGLK